MIKCYKLMVVRFRSAEVSWFYFRPTSKRWLLKIVQVTTKYDSFDVDMNSCRLTSILHSTTPLVPQP